MNKLNNVIALVFMVAVPLLASAGEGFFSLASSPSTAVRDAFISFPVGHDCGATRIHAQRQIYITALHCTRDGLEADGSTELGNPLNPESLVHYDDHSGEQLQIQNMKLKILANGSCWTGFGLDVIGDLNAGEQQLAIKCLQGDWLIFELVSGSSAKSCIKAKYQFSSGASIVATGGPRVVVQRTVGMTKLDGRVYSTGRIYDLNSLVSAPSYPASVVPLWQSFRSAFTSANRDFILTDADIINGMSGGPITDGDSLIGVSTVGLLPNSLYNYPELHPIADGYNFGIHGGISMKQLHALDPKVAQYFECP